MSFRVTGGAEVRMLARDLDAAGKSVTREIGKGMRRAAQPLIQDIRAEAAQVLPHRGGLAAYVASLGIRVSTFTAGTSAGVTVVGTRTKRGGKVDLEALNSGALRHPVFTNATWTSQQVHPNFWDGPVGRNESSVQREMLGVVEELRRRIEG